MIRDSYERYATVEATKKSTHSTNRPVLLCNTIAEQIPNKHILERTVPLFKRKVIPEYRPEFKVCTKYINKNDPIPLPSDPPTLHQAFVKEININNTLSGRDKKLDPCEKKRIQQTAEYVNHFNITNISTKNVWNNKTKRKEIGPVIRK